MYEIKNHKLLKDGQPVAWVPTKNKSGVIKPLYIVLHDTASPLSSQGDISWLAGNGNNGSSAHFVVARDGKITQLANCNVKTWHAGVSKWNGKLNCNDFTIGIEIDNPGKMTATNDKGKYVSYFGTIVEGDGVEFSYRETPQHGKGFWCYYTKEQIDAVVGMCQAMVKAYGCTEIITHWMISPGRKIDTNPLFPLELVRERALGNKDGPPAGGWAPQPTPFVDDATVLVDSLNLRAQPEMGNNVIASLAKGTRVDIRGVHDNWLLVMTADNKGGYLHKTMVQQD